MKNEAMMVSQSGELNPAPTEKKKKKISRVDHVLYLTGDVNFTLPKSIVWERNLSNSANLKRFIPTKKILLAGDKQDA